MQDFPLFQRIGNDLTGATDNMRGLQDSGGRKTATEVAKDVAEKATVALVPE